MKLTGVAKKALELYIEQNHNIHSTEWQDLNTTCQNALIIEFFDSVGIYISIVWEFECFESYVNSKCVSIYSNSRTEATNEAIIKANEIFNLNNK